jgi:hypothetical protein
MQEHVWALDATPLPRRPVLPVPLFSDVLVKSDDDRKKKEKRKEQSLVCLVCRV